MSVKLTAGLIKAVKQARKDAIALPALFTYRGKRYVLEACPGEAHRNPHIDNCGLCAPLWGTTIALEAPSEPEIYCTSYCNHGHEVATGRPVGHECRYIPPAALQAERAGDFERAVALMATGSARTVRGK